MKRIIGTILIVVLFLTGSSFASSLDNDIQIVLEDKLLQNLVSPFIQNGTTLVPVRELTESMGAKVYWDGNNKIVRITKGNNEIILTIGKKEALVNGQKKYLKIAPMIKNGNTFVNLRFISEHFNHKVYWNSLTETIFIESINQEISEYTTKVINGNKYTGELIDGVPNGYGSGTFSNNDRSIRYDGIWHNGKPNGYGKIYSGNGSLIAEGFFYNGKMHGNMTFYDKKGEKIEEKTFYKGQLSENVKIEQLNYLYKYSNGNIFIGQLKDGLPNGYGELYDRSHTLLYKGEMLKENYNGYGIVYRSDGSISFEGKFDEGIKSGYGKTYDYRGKLVYSGEFSNGLYNGNGVLFHENGNRKYDGTFENGQYANGSLYRETELLKYTGDFKGNEMDGVGKLYSDNGYLLYTGDFKEGKISGEGTMYRSDNSIYYVGTWNNNETTDGEFYNSRGELVKDKQTISVVTDDVEIKSTQLTLKDGSIYQGDLKDGKPHGYGEVYYTDSDVLMFKGQYVNGAREGYGTLYYPNGQIRYKGSWSNSSFGSYSKDGEFSDSIKTGTLYNKEGQKIYAGGFLNGEFHGVGKQYDQNGYVKKDGLYANGKLIGIGKKLANGNMYYGGYNDNQEPDGYGYIYENGKKIVEGQFKNNIFINGKEIEYTENGKSYIVYDGTFIGDSIDYKKENGTLYKVISEATGYTERVFKGKFIVSEDNILGEIGDKYLGEPIEDEVVQETTLFLNDEKISNEIDGILDVGNDTFVLINNTDKYLNLNNWAVTTEKNNNQFNFGPNHGIPKFDYIVLFTDNDLYQGRNNKGIKWGKEDAWEDSGDTTIVTDNLGNEVFRKESE